MLFVKLNPQQVASYSYACTKLENIAVKMKTARKKLEEAAMLSSDNFFSKCIHMFNSETMQLEHEIHAQINSFNCSDLFIAKKSKEISNQKTTTVFLGNMRSLYSYVQKNYIQPYKKLLKDKNLNYALKGLINSHLRSITLNLMQLKLFMQVHTSVN